MPKRFDPELGDLEVRPSGGSLKSWDTVNVMSNASLLREKQNWGAGGAVSSKQYGLVPGWVLCCEHV